MDFFGVLGVVFFNMKIYLKIIIIIITIYIIIILYQFI